MADYPFVVRVPRTHVDETTMGEWLESRAVDYRNNTAYPARAALFEFQFSCRVQADAFARNFVDGGPSQPARECDISSFAAPWDVGIVTTRGV